MPRICLNIKTMKIEQHYVKTNVIFIVCIVFSSFIFVTYLSEVVTIGIYTTACKPLDLGARNFRAQMYIIFSYVVGLDFPGA